MKKIFKYIVLLFVLFIFPLGTKAVTEYTYSDIKNCYFKGQSEQVAKSIIRSTGTEGCLQLDTSRQYTVDYEKLKSTNSCQDGYELYSVSQKMLDDNGLEWDVFGYGCRKVEREITKTLYCGYALDYGSVMIVYNGNNIEIRESSKTQKETGEEEGEYVNPGLTSYVPLWKDKSWRRNAEVKATFLNTEKYNNNKMTDCPRYVFEIRNDSNKLTEYVFTDDDLKTEDEIDAYSYATDLRRVAWVYNDEDDNLNDNYYDSFDSNICEELDEWKDAKTCVYEGEEHKITYKLYMSSKKYFIAIDSSGIDFFSYFTFNELKNKNNGQCPKEMYFWSDGTSFSLALEDTENKAVYRNKAVLKQQINEVEVPLYCKDVIDLIPSRANCTTLFGSPDVPGKPAYYMQIVFEIMKYAAIVLLIVLSIMDYVGAVASSDQDAMKKATTKMVTRLIICVVLFILPTLLKLVFQIAGIYDAANCGIS